MTHQLPSFLHDDADRIVVGVASGRVPTASLSRVWAWLEDEGYGELMDDSADCDWIVADSRAIAAYYFSDQMLRDHISSPLEDSDQEITNADRIAYMRQFFDEFPERMSESQEYPAVATYEIRSPHGQAFIGVLLRFQGQAGFALELKGAFSSRNDLRSKLHKQGFIEVPRLRERAQISDKRLLGMWRRLNDAR